MPRTITASPVKVALRYVVATQPRLTSNWPYINRNRKRKRLLPEVSEFIQTLPRRMKNPDTGRVVRTYALPMDVGSKSRRMLWSMFKKWKAKGPPNDPLLAEIKRAFRSPALFQRPRQGYIEYPINALVRMDSPGTSTKDTTRFNPASGDTTKVNTKYTFYHVDSHFIGDWRGGYKASAPLGTMATEDNGKSWYFTSDDRTKTLIKSVDGLKEAIMEQLVFNMKQKAMRDMASF